MGTPRYISFAVLGDRVTLEAAVKTLRVLATRRPMDEGSVRFHRDDRVCRIVLDNPTARNAVTLEMMAQLGDAVQVLQTHQSGIVVLEAAPHGAFCSGGDLRQVMHAIDGERAAYDMSTAMQAITTCFSDLPQLTVAVLDGAAIGGGAELAVACDHRVMGENAWIQFAHGRLGIAPGWGGTRRLVSLIGDTEALEVLTAQPRISSTDTRTALVTRTAATGEEALKHFLELRSPVAAPALRAIKAQVVATRVRSEQAFHEDASAFAARWGTPEHLEALPEWVTS